MKSISEKLIAILLAVVTLFSVMSVMVSAATVTNTEIVEYARTFEGVPYVWGGHSPAGFDCSGFVNYVFTQKGIKLNNDSEWYKTVSNYGTEVSAEEALPGDIVVWAGHVGIYLGDGWCISALSGSKNKVYVHTVASFTGGSVKLYGRPNGVDYGKSTGESYQVTSEEYNAILTYENGCFTATMIDPDLEESYPTNLSSNEINHLDFGWIINFTDGKDQYDVGTYSWNSKGYHTENQMKTLYEMQNSVFKNGYCIEDVTLNISGTKLVWTFEISDEHDFDVENMKITDVKIYKYGKDVDKISQSTNDTFLDEIINFFEILWRYIKMPFDFILALFS